MKKNTAHSMVEGGLAGLLFVAAMAAFVLEHVDQVIARMSPSYSTVLLLSAVLFAWNANLTYRIRKLEGTAQNPVGSKTCEPPDVQ